MEIFCARGWKYGLSVCAVCGVDSAGMIGDSANDSAGVRCVNNMRGSGRGSVDSTYWC